MNTFSPQAADNHSGSGIERRREVAEDVGKLLAQTRQDRGLAIDECAQALHLPVQLLREIEDGSVCHEWDVYLRGHLRSYGRYLELSEDQLEDILQHLSQLQPPPLVSKRVSSIRYQFEHYGRIATYVVLTLGIGVPLVWFGMHWEYGSVVTPHSEQIDAEPVALAAPSNVTVALPSGGKGTVRVRSGETLQASMSPFSVMTSSASETSQGSTLAGSGHQAKASAADRSIDSPDAGYSAHLEHTLTIRAHAPCWIEVQTQDGKRLAYTLLAAGSVRTFRSREPLKVLIGDSRAAEITIDGKPFKLPGAGSARIVRFQVGSSHPQ